MDKKKWTKISKISKKIKSINILGGNCEICGEDDIFKLCFHHESDKATGINKIKNGSWDLIESEISKCRLFCHNCHLEHHHGDKNTKHQNNKKIYLEIKGVLECESCGYNKCKSSLQFHHIKEKKFNLSSLNKEIRSLSDVESHIIDEINKCEVICANCHVLKHSDLEFYKNNYDEIINKSKNIKVVKKIDYELVLKLHNDGMTNSEISKKLNCRRESIWHILKTKSN